MIDKSIIAGFINNADLNKKVEALTTKAELKAAQDKMIMLQVFDSSYFCSKSHFEDDGTQLFSVSASIEILYKDWQYGAYFSKQI